MKEYFKVFKILGYRAVYYFNETLGFIYIRYGGNPEDYLIFTNYRDAFASVLELCRIH